MHSQSTETTRAGLRDLSRVVVHYRRPCIIDADNARSRWPVCLLVLRTGTGHLIINTPVTRSLTWPSHGRLTDFSDVGHCSGLSPGLFKMSYITNTYFGVGFTSAYNSTTFCCLQRNVEPCCHTHDSRSTVTVYSAKSRLVGLAVYTVTVMTVTAYSASRLVVQYPQ